MCEMILAGKSPGARKKSVPVPLSPPQTPHRLAWMRSVPSLGRGR